MRVYDKLQDRFISVTKLGVQRGDTTCNRDTTFVFMDRLFAAHLYIFDGGQWPCGAPAVGLDVLLTECGASRGAGVLVFASLIDDSSASEPVDTWWVFDIDEAEERRSLLDANDNHQQTFKTRKKQFASLWLSKARVVKGEKEFYILDDNQFLLAALARTAALKASEPRHGSPRRMRHADAADGAVAGDTAAKEAEAGSSSVAEKIAADEAATEAAAAEAAAAKAAVAEAEEEAKVNDWVNARVNEGAQARPPPTEVVAAAQADNAAGEQLLPPPPPVAEVLPAGATVCWVVYLSEGPWYQTTWGEIQHYRLYNPDHDFVVSMFAAAANGTAQEALSHGTACYVSSLPQPCAEKVAADKAAEEAATKEAASKEAAAKEAAAKEAAAKEARRVGEQAYARRQSARTHASSTAAGAAAGVVPRLPKQPKPKPTPGAAAAAAPVLLPVGLAMPDPKSTPAAAAPAAVGEVKPEHTGGVKSERVSRQLGYKASQLAAALRELLKKPEAAAEELVEARKQFTSFLTQPGYTPSRNSARLYDILLEEASQHPLLAAADALQAHTAASLAAATPAPVPPPPGHLEGSMMTMLNAAAVAALEPIATQAAEAARAAIASQGAAHRPLLPSCKHPNPTCYPNPTSSPHRPSPHAPDELRALLKDNMEAHAKLAASFSFPSTAPMASSFSATSTSGCSSTPVGEKPLAAPSPPVELRAAPAACSPALPGNMVVAHPRSTLQQQIIDARARQAELATRKRLREQEEEQERAAAAAVKRVREQQEEAEAAARVARLEVLAASQ